jgi:hypothetical protein
MLYKRKSRGRSRDLPPSQEEKLPLKFGEYRLLQVFILDMANTVVSFSLVDNDHGQGGN